MSKSNFKVQVYDFIAHGITTEYDSVIGLDFFREIVLTIDFKDYKIIIQ